MKICIYGAGAVGGHLAAKLAAAGQDVSVVARGEHLTAIRRDGVTLLVGDRQIVGKVTASDRPEELGLQDVVIVTLKATALPAFAASVAPLLHAGTMIVFAQNGVPWWYAKGPGAERAYAPALAALDPDGAIAAAVSLDRVIGAVIFSSNDVIRPGVILSDSPDGNALVIGEIDDAQSDRVMRLRAILDDAGVSSPATDDIRKIIWTKLCFNMSGSSLCLLTEQPVAVFAQNPAIAGVRVTVAAEGKAIAKAIGVDLDIPVKGFPQNMARPLPVHRPSILVDYERNRPMEIECMLMAPLNLARSAGVPTPALEVIAAVAAQRAASKGLYRLPCAL